jgi:hypothetical protein
VRIIGYALAVTLASTAAFAQSNQTPPPNPPSHTTQSATAPAAPRGNASDQRAASGNNNQAVATTNANAATPAKGANSFTESQAKSRLQDDGFSDVSGLKKDDNGVWRGTAHKNNQQVSVWLDYKGNAGEGQ